MIPIYLISGIGADERIFRKLNLQGYELKFIQWIPPFPNETIQDYSIRLSAQINTSDPIIIGFSLGAIIAVEISHYLKAEKTIIISGIKSYKQMPVLYKIAGILKIDKLIPSCFYKHSTFIAKLFFATGSKNDQSLIGSIINHTDTNFLKWAIHGCLQWRTKMDLKNCIQIHGSADRILPIKYIQADYIIQNGSHLLLMYNATELSVLLQQVLNPC